MKDTIICDLDGTLCDITHRLRHVEQSPKNWDAFFSGVLDDSVNKPVLRVLSKFRNTAEIIFCSGRPERCRKDTYLWLYRFACYETVSGFEEFKNYKLYMRKDGDFRPDHEVKQEILDSSIDKDRVLFVLDDRQQVVDMWRRNGLTCFQVAEGNF